MAGDFVDDICCTLHQLSPRVRVAGAGLPMPSVTLPVTTSVKAYQVVCHIVTEPTPELHVMDLQAFHGTALLAPPTISLQDARPE